MSGVGSVTASEARLVALAAEAERGPRRDGLYALWLTLRAAEALLPPHPVSIKNHRRRLVALEHRLGGLALPAAALVLSQLVAPCREVLGAEAAEAVAAAARDARLH